MVTSASTSLLGVVEQNALLHDHDLIVCFVVSPLTTKVGEQRSVMRTRLSQGPKPTLPVAGIVGMSIELELLIWIIITRITFPCL